MCVLNMDTEKIFSQLKEGFGLRNKHIMILRMLKDGDQICAEKICKETGIPQGRIYEYLNCLIKEGLIDKTNHKPAQYYADNLKKNVIRFMKSKMDRMITTENEIMELMRGSNTEFISKIDNREMFTAEHLNMVVGGDEMKIMAVHRSYPFLLYPDNIDLFMEFRKLFASKRPTISRIDYETSYRTLTTYRDALRRETKFELVFERTTFETHIKLIEQEFGKEELQKYLQYLAKLLKKVNVYVSEEYNPMEIEMTENKVLLAVIHLGISTGIVMQSESVIKLFETYFEQKRKRSEPLIKTVEKLLEL